MCGIAGFVSAKELGKTEAQQAISAMNDAIRHRGPDADGHWLSGDRLTAMGQRRLAIVDLTPTGAQPMTSRSGRYTIVFNGEIYGFLDLRRELEAKGVVFRGSSDTEVLLETIDQIGLEPALARCGGMFAFAVHDGARNEVSFARDRLGKKPLYIGRSRGLLVFGSELKALRAHPSFQPDSIDAAAINHYTRLHYIPAPYTCYSNVIMLPPASCLTLNSHRLPATRSDLLSLVRTYWNQVDMVSRARANVFSSEDEALHELESMLRTSVAERLVADVRVGAFLSGGVDSSLVTSIMQEVSDKPVKTFTIRFGEAKFNEADIAAQTARHLGTEHTELTATPNLALELVESLADVYDEPFADASQIPTIAVSKMAREHVTVALSGDGGDEFFAGYKRYPQMLAMNRLAQRLPPMALPLIEACSVPLLDASLKIARPLLPKSMQQDLSADRLKKLAPLLREKDFVARYLHFMSEWPDPTAALQVPGGAVNSPYPSQVPEGLSDLERMMYIDMMVYLPHDVLVKVDRASMAFGLEMRAPLLDYRLAELAWRMPASMRLVNGTGKIALRRLLGKRLPPEITNQPKRGFSVPINEWLRGPLKQWANDLLSEASVRKSGTYNTQAVQKRWTEHQSGSRNWGSSLWTILMFQTWYFRHQRG